MTVNYTTNLALGQPVTGTESGTWGDDVNNSVTSYLDIAISGSLALTSASFTANALTLTNTQGTSSATNIGAPNGSSQWTAQYYVLRVSSLAASVTITAPSVSKTYLVVNADATYSVTVKASGQTGISVAPGERATVYYNGTDYIKVTSSVVSNLTGVLPVANGGTGVTTSTGSGNNVLSTSPTFVTPILGTPTSATLTNATGLPLTTGVTGTLPVANGGTGVTTSTGSGSVVLSTSPTLVTPALGTPASGNLANCTFPTLNQNTTGNAATATTLTTTVNSGVTGTTQVAGTNNTTIATTAFVQTALQLIYPVGSIYSNASSATNPGTLFGFGTWTAFGAGRVMLGAGTGGGGTYTAGGTGGNKDATGLPSHTHTASFTGDALPAHAHDFVANYPSIYDGASNGNNALGYAQTRTTTSVSAGTPSGTVTVNATSSGVTDGNLQPYIVVYMWQRTA